MFDRQPTQSASSSTLSHATSTIDELTVALTNYSRLPSPELEYFATCCCGRKDCANTKSWAAFKSALENRLILSAEVGQALLQKHDSYVQQHEVSRLLSYERNYVDAMPKECHKLGTATALHDSIPSEIAELRREKAALEKRLNQALVNAEVAEVSTKTAHQELEEARATIVRLTVQNAKSLGWDNRLSAVVKEKDDLQQERDSEAARAKAAESRLTALRQRMAKVQREVRQLQQDLEQRRSYRLESSKTLLHEARARIESLQESLGQSAMVEQAELLKVVGSLIDDNDSLKRDNAELQSLLAEAREDIQHMQEELEEQRANPTSLGGAAAFHGLQVHSGSVPASSTMEQLGRRRRPSSLSRHPFQLPTPDLPPRPLSPADSFATSETPSFGQPNSRYPRSQLSFDLDDDTLVLKETFQSRSVQTDLQLGLLSPSPFLSSSPSPSALRSESSSVSESQVGHISTLVERMAALLSRMTQADPLTLTNRLKRQHLRGADVGHLSRSTIGNIINDITHIRYQFRTLLEDEKANTLCTRKDLRGLFKLFKDVFTEMGTMRATLNDIILDPSIAINFSEQALNPEKSEASKGKIAVTNQNPTLGGWIAPLSKLFGAPSPVGPEANQPNRVTSPLSRGNTIGAPGRPIPKIIPKQRPALSASNTTVNVEFSGSGLGRSVTNTFSAHATIKADPQIGLGQPPHSSGSSAMDLFAGAPRVPTDPWILIPNAPKRSATLNPDATIGRRWGRTGLSRFSRDVDAVIDIPATPQPMNAADVDTNEEQDEVPPLLQRTLRRRGLSDSSIHSTFSTHQEDAGSSPTQETPSPEETSPGMSVLQAFSRTVQNFRIPSMASMTHTPELVTSPVSSTFSRPSRPQTAGSIRIPRNRALPTAWQTPDPFEAGSIREEDLLHRQHMLG
ncbi:hypothetical protein PLEOSDRAFT_1064358 [Pleurotus ostreatus PC15]|uniref:Uncharacterized protein n=1 Tax=Pleurotus ostreatus (strain PC15) TaxID=1137138 RepID=A0A067NN96_PLEO1|nr:hypothetical protein PLEOSDRAFT_1064358 [Pleurotus ostreatus PC15]